MDKAPDPAPVARQHRPVMPDADKVWLVPLDVHLQAVDSLLTPDLRARFKAEFEAYLGKAQPAVLVGNRLIDLACTTVWADRPVAEARRTFGLYHNRALRKTI